MKWKEVLTTVAVVLLIVVLALLLIRGRNPDAQAQNTKNRIEQYEIIAEEQRLITEILRLRYEAALIQQKFSPAPQPVQQRPVVPEVKE